MKNKLTKEQEELIKKTNPTLWKLEREYKTYDVIVKFLLTTRDDFDTGLIKEWKWKLSRWELKWFVDKIPLYRHSDIQYGSQFSLWLTYNHIWAYYDELKEYFTEYIESLN